MPFTRARGPRYRGVRRFLVVTAAIAVIVLAACAPAWAGESDPGAPSTTADTTALARVAISESRFDDALRVLGRASAPERSDAERAAAFEVRGVVERWVALHQVIFPRDIGVARGSREVGDEASVAGAPSDRWETSFAVARAQLVAGDFDLAAPGFSALQAAARDAPASLRARALGALARDLDAKRLVLGWTELAPRSIDARARPDGHVDPTGRRSHTRRWYGWQTLMADGASVLLVPVIGSQLDTGDGTALVLAVVGGYALAPGIIHLGHGRPGTAAASVGLRVGLPFTGGLLGLAAAEGSCRGDLCGLGGAALGFALGVIGASALDAAVLSFESLDGDVDDDEKAARASARAAPRSAIRFVPIGGPRREGGFDVGVGATF